MSKYIGTKIVEATPAVKIEGRIYLYGEPTPRCMAPSEEGYQVIYQDGYKSFSPKAVFEEAYRKLDGDDTFDFGTAISALKLGKKVNATGWGDAYLFLTDEKIIPTEHLYDPLFKEIAVSQSAPRLTLGAHINLRTVGGDVIIGWTPSQTDMLALDWRVVE